MNPGVIAFVTLTVFVAASSYRAAQSPVTASAPAPVATASIDGIAVKQGTPDPIPGAEVELTRVEGTTASPLSPGFLEAYNAIVAAGGNSDSAPPAAIIPEVQYLKTGMDGKFAFKNLKAGKYKLVAIKTGGTYYPAEFGQHDPRQRGVPFPVADGQTVKDVRIEMIQPAAITGRVLDTDGEPLGHAIVMALDPQYRPGGRRILNIEQVIPTDEHGEYRIHWLVPGPHYVAALLEDPRRRTIAMDSVPPGRRGPLERAESPYVVHRTLPTGESMDEAYQLVYFGGTLSPAFAKEIDAPAGGTFPSADISMAPGKLRAWHIRGVVIDGTTGKPSSNATVRAIPRDWNPDILVLNTTTDTDGKFDLTGAVPGSYTIFATSLTSTSGSISIPPELAAAAAAAGILLSSLTGGGATTGVVSIPLEVAAGDVDKLQLVTNAGVQVAGRVVVEGRPASGTEADLSKIRISLTRDPDLIASPSVMAPLPPLPPGTTNTTPRPGNGQVNASGSFTLQTWLGDSRVSVAGVPAETYIKSIRLGSFDVMTDGLHLAASAENPLEVVMGTDGGTITGLVVVDQREPQPNAVVALVPDLPAQRRRPEYYQTANTDFKGNFQFQNIPPGNYKVFAWEFAQPDSWQNTDFIRAYEEFGKPIRVDERSKQNITMSAISK